MQLKYIFQKKTGFTLIEILVIIGIMFILATLTFPLFRTFQKQTNLVSSSEKIINELRLAQNKTIASEQESQWGVFFDNSVEPNQYILFKGQNYQSRDNSFDSVNQLSEEIEVYQIDLFEEEPEVVFNPIIGTTNNFGSLSLRLKNNHQKNINIFIEFFGQISLVKNSTSSDLERIKDSRQIYLNYNRFIDISSENIILTFNNEIIEEIPIINNIVNSQIYWQGEVNVNGDVQQIKIHTLELNNPESLFCIHRDQRYNNNSLKVEMSGDQSGSLIEYSADGLITVKTSIYATDIEWQ